MKLQICSGYDFFNDTHKKNYVLLESVQEFIEIEAWMPLTFLLCLHNQLTTIRSIVTK